MNIPDIIADHGLSVEEVCRKAVVSSATLRAWRSGKYKPSPASIAKLSSAFASLAGISPDAARSLLFADEQGMTVVLDEESVRRCNALADLWDIHATDVPATAVQRMYKEDIAPVQE